MLFLFVDNEVFWSMLGQVLSCSEMGDEGKRQ